jgi:hypothetical protein
MRFRREIGDTTSEFNAAVGPPSKVRFGHVGKVAISLTGRSDNIRWTSLGGELRPSPVFI